MDEGTIISEFDRLVEAGLVIYDPEQKIVELADDGLKVVRIQIFSRILSLTHIIVPIHSHIRALEKAWPARC